MEKNKYANPEKKSSEQIVLKLLMKNTSSAENKDLHLDVKVNVFSAWNTFQLKEDGGSYELYLRSNTLWTIELLIEEYKT